MKILNYPILKLLIALLIGIILGYHFYLKPTYLWYVLLFLLILAFVLNTIKKIARTYQFSVFLVILFVGIGMLTASLHSKANPNHYSHFYQSGSEVTFRISEKLKSTTYSHRYTAEVLKIDSDECHGKILLQLKKDADKEFEIPKVDYVYTTNQNLSQPNSPLNPHQFNYKKYLQNQQIYHQLYLTAHELILTNTSIKTVQGYAAALRNKINNRLSKYPYKEEIAILNALLLGQRQEVSAETYQQYAAAGAVHLLAISGLHIGLILLFLNIALKLLERIKHGKTIKLICTIVILWCFAIIAGLSASVVRAVTMFTFIAYAMYLKRTHNIYHALISSMFILLLFKPNFIYDVGFQLSYTAVFGIVWIQPVIAGFWTTHNRILHYFWQLLTVTIAAQLSVLPLSLYYFHQFPGLFFVSNLLIVPFIGVLLGFGFCIILLSLLNILPNLLAEAYFGCIEFMNSFIGWIAAQENFIFSAIHFDVFKMLVSYLVIISFVLLLKERKQTRIIAFFGSIFVFISTFLYTNYRAEQKQRFIVFHKSRTSEIALQHGRKLTLFNKDLEDDYNIKNYVLGENISKLKVEKPNKYIEFKNQKIFVLDSMPTFPKDIDVDILLITYSPKINLDRALNQLQPKQVIADGSNYKSFIMLWKKSCAKRKIPFHYTGEKGSFILE
ncbi:ComEC family competence protein [Galbibacter sp. BG1]|uniref:ComEC/Rec2 family competence protein n=1 Tax=Galbibacter sp. BG1 TaxID=1170699 RepID=UPI0015BAABDE|nr:ComEC/Rec2 family competence protein [Galbibacter sp. BG1]QLE00661.1 ComEC family competence protein [Galbibacter sp. BG1]